MKIEDDAQARRAARQHLLTIVSYAFPAPSQLFHVQDPEMLSRRSRDELTEKALLALIFVLILLAIALHLKT